MRIECLENLEGSIAYVGTPRRPDGHRARRLEWLRRGGRIDAIGRLWGLCLAVRLAVSRGGCARHSVAGGRARPGGGARVSPPPGGHLGPGKWPTLGGRAASLPMWSPFH